MSLGTVPAPQLFPALRVPLCARELLGGRPQGHRGAALPSPNSHRARELVRRVDHYLTANLDRMDYPAYRVRGLRVGSGAIESANFHVTGTRLKLQGMRWSEQGARQMATLRADLFNGNHEARTRQILAA